MKGVQCFELFGGIALKIHTFSFFSTVWCCSLQSVFTFVCCYYTILTVLCLLLVCYMNVKESKVFVLCD